MAAVAGGIRRQSTNRGTKAGRKTGQSHKAGPGLLPFQPRPEVPKQVLKEAKNLLSLGVPMTAIHRILSDPRNPYTKGIPGFKPQTLNYYDIWKELGNGARQKAEA